MTTEDVKSSPGLSSSAVAVVAVVELEMAGFLRSAEVFGLLRRLCLVGEGSVAPTGFARGDFRLCFFSSGVEGLLADRCMDV